VTAAALVEAAAMLAMAVKVDATQAAALVAPLVATLVAVGAAVAKAVAKAVSVPAYQYSLISAR
jgi:hypothetical protein